MEENFNNGTPAVSTDGNTTPAQQFPDPVQPFAQPEQQFTQPVQQFAQPEQPQYSQPSAPQSDNGYQQYNSADFTAYPTVTPIAAPRSKAPLFIALGVAVIAALVALFIFVIMPMLGGGYEKSERQFFSSALSSAESATDTITAKNLTDKVTLSIDLTDEITKQLTNSDLTLNPTTIEFLSKVSDGNVSGIVSWLNGTKTVTSLNFWCNSDGKEALVQLPDFLDKFIRMTVDTATSSTSQYSISEDDIKVLKKVVDDASDGYFDAVAPATTMLKDTYQADITVDYDVAQIKFTDKEVINICISLFEAIKKNPEVFDIFARLGYNSINAEMIDSYITSFKAQRDSCTGTELFTMNVYLKDGTSIGRNIRIDNKKVFDYLCYSGSNGTAAYLYFNYNSTTIDVKTNSKKNGSAYTGDATFSVASSGETKAGATLGFKDVEISENVFTGTFSLAVPSIALTLDGTMTTEGDKQQIVLEAYVTGTKAATVTIANEKNAAADTIPAKPDESTIEIIDINANTVASSGAANELTSAFSDTEKLNNFISKLADDNGTYDIIGYLISALTAGSQYTQSEPIDEEVVPSEEITPSEEAVESEVAEEMPSDLSFSEYYTALADAYDYYLMSDGNYDLAAMFKDLGEEYVSDEETDAQYQLYFKTFVECLRKVASGEMTEDEFTAMWYE